MNAYTNQYINNQILSASKEQILLMLYDGAIRFTRQAKAAIENDDMATKGKYIGKAMAIISEFSNSLDHDIGGDIATDLDALYTYMLKELSYANVNNEESPLDSVINLLTDLRQTWDEAIKINNTSSQKPQSTQPVFNQAGV